MRSRILRTCCAAVVVLAMAPARSGAATAIPLIEAARTGDVTTARALVMKGANVNAVEIDGTTALHWAADRGDAAMVTLLINAGAKVKAVNRYGVTAFALACQKGHAAVIERLLAAGEEANAVLGGEHVLMMAAKAGNEQAVKALLAHGADVNFKEPARRQTALMWAAAEGNTAVVKALLEAGADLRARSKAPPPPPLTGRTPRVNDPLGLRANRDPSWAMNTEGLEFTALLFAARAGRIESAKALLDAGADVNEAKTDDGTTALILSIINANFEMAAVLLDRGADPNRGPGYTALHEVAWTRRLNTYDPVALPHPEPTGTLGSLDLAKKILAKGVNINAQMTRSFRDGYRNRMNRVGATAFLLSAKLVDLPMMKLLVASGADIHIQNEDKDTPLMLAAGVSLHNPNEDAGSEGEVLEAVQYLMGLGFDVNTINRNNETAMHGASYRGLPSLATFLYEHGAKIDVPNVLGWTPLKIADGLFFTGFYKAQPVTAALLRDLYRKEGLPVPAPPKVNDTDLLTLDKAQAAAAAKDFGCSYVGLCKDEDKNGEKNTDKAAPGQPVKPAKNEK